MTDAVDCGAISLNIQFSIKSADAGSALADLNAQLADPNSALWSGAMTGNLHKDQDLTIRMSCAAGTQISQDSATGVCEPCPFNQQVRKTPRWPRSRANFSLLWLYSHSNAWANLHRLGQPNTLLAAAER